MNNKSVQKRYKKYDILEHLETEIYFKQLEYERYLETAENNSWEKSGFETCIKILNKATEDLNRAKNEVYE